MLRNTLLKSAAIAFALVYSHLSLGAVVQIAPDGAVTDPVPVFSWQEDSTANWYLLWISNADNSQTLYQQWIHNDSLTVFDGGCSYAPDASFAEGESYSWWVQPRSDEAIGEWSDGLTFDIVSEYDISPMIKGVFTDETCEHLFINGINFGEHPKVYLDQFPLVLSECGVEHLIADLPEGLSPGNFRLKVIRMPETSVEGEILTNLQSDEMDFTVGATGPAGPQGPQGETGPRGAKGDTGDRGAKGDTGAQGPKGAKGNTGATGAQGPQGDRGHTGATGAQGPQGERGETGPQGLQGIQGAQGIPGPQGLQGLQGEKGDPGLSWKGSWDAGTTYTQDDAAYYSGNAYVSIADPNTGNTPDSSPAQWDLLASKGDTGAQGLQGPAGADGAQGPQGIQGPQGSQGPTGADGAQGAQGPQGIQGPAGADGSDATLDNIGFGYVNVYPYKIVSALAAKPEVIDVRDHIDHSPSWLKVTGGYSFYLEDGTNVMYISSIGGYWNHTDPEGYEIHLPFENLSLVNQNLGFMIFYIYKP